VEELAACVQKLYVRAGAPSLRDLEKLARDATGLLPGTNQRRVPLGRNSINQMLRGRSFPRKAFFLTFIALCGVPLETDRRWEEAWERVALRRLNSKGTVPLAAARPEEYPANAAPAGPKTVTVPGTSRLPAPGRLSDPPEIKDPAPAVPALLPEEGTPPGSQRHVPVPAERAEDHYARGVRLGRLGRAAEALAAYEQAIALRPDYADSHYNRGVTLEVLGRYEEALAAYDQAIALQPEHEDAYHNRGVALWQLGRHEDALAAYDQALSLRPEDAHAHYGRGLVLAALGRNGEAVSAYEQALRLQPGNGDAHYDRGVALARLGRHEAALDAFDEAIRLQPGNGDAHYDRGVALEHLGHLTDALTALDRAAETRPAHPGTHYHRGRVLAQLDRPADAVKAYDQALQLAPDHADTHFRRGVALTALGQHEQALASYVRADVMRPDHPDTQVHLARTRAQLNSPADALADHDEAIKQQPKPEDTGENGPPAGHEPETGQSLSSPAQSKGKTEESKQDLGTTSADSPQRPPADPVHPRARLRAARHRNERSRTPRVLLLMFAIVLAAGTAVGLIFLPGSGRHFPATVPPSFTSPGDKAITSISFSPDGKTLAVTDNTNDVYLWSTATGKITGTLSAPQGDIAASASFSPDGKTVAIAGEDGYIYLSDTATHKITDTLTNPDTTYQDVGITSVSFSPDGKTLAGVDQASSVHLWSIASGAVTATLANPSNFSDATTPILSFSPGGNTLVGVSNSGDLTVWEINTPDDASSKLPYYGQGIINSIAFSPGGTLAIASSTGTIYLFNPADATAGNSRRYAMEDLSCIAYSPDGKTLAVGIADHVRLGAAPPTTLHATT
jgi:tetratricopeptide (TPR) repeat protein